MFYHISLESAGYGWADLNPNGDLLDLASNFLDYAPKQKAQKHDDHCDGDIQSPPAKLFTLSSRLVKKTKQTESQSARMVTQQVITNSEKNNLRKE